MFAAPKQINHPVPAPDVSTLLVDTALMLGHTMRIDAVKINDQHRHDAGRFTEYDIAGTIVPAGENETFNFKLVVKAVYEPKACDPDDVARLVNKGTQVTDAEGTVLTDSIPHIPDQWYLLDNIDGDIEGYVRYIAASTVKY